MPFRIDPVAIGVILAPIEVADDVAGLAPGGAALDVGDGEDVAVPAAPAAGFTSRMSTSVGFRSMIADGFFGGSLPGLSPAGLPGPLPGPSFLLLIGARGLQSTRNGARTTARRGVSIPAGSLVVTDVD